MRVITLVALFAILAIWGFVLSAWLFAHLSPHYTVNAVPPEGMEDTFFRGHLEFACPHVSYVFRYSFPVAVTSIQLMVEGRALPINLCRPSSAAPGAGPVCNPAGGISARNVPVPVCAQIRDSAPLVRITPRSGSAPLAVGTLVRHATE